MVLHYVYILYFQLIVWLYFAFKQEFKVMHYNFEVFVGSKSDEVKVKLNMIKEIIKKNFKANSYLKFDHKSKQTRMTTFI